MVIFSCVLDLPKLIVYHYPFEVELAKNCNRLLLCTRNFLFSPAFCELVSASSIKMPVLGHLPNSLKSQIVRRSRFPICPSVSKLPAHAKNPSISFIPSLSFFVFPVYRMMCNTSPFSVFGQPPFFVMCEGSHILKKGNPQHLRKRVIPNISKKGNPPNSEIYPECFI